MTGSRGNPGFSGTQDVTQTGLELMTLLVSAGIAGMGHICPNSSFKVVEQSSCWFSWLLSRPSHPKLIAGPVASLIGI